MLNKLRIATLILIAVSLAIPTVAFAEEEVPERYRLRFAGEVTGVVPGQGTFTLHTRAGEDLEFQTDERTRFRSRDGSVEDIHDLKTGMKALVIALRTEEGLQALVVAAGNPEDLPERFKAVGEIQSVDEASGTFELKTRKGDILNFATGERTRYRGEGIDGLGDLEPGMHALVVAVEGEGELPLALLVAAREPKERPERIRVIGEITGVNPGQGTFSLQSRAGEDYEFTTSDRTRFRSRDGSIQDIHDLERGMHAIVAAIETEEGDLLALLVAARAAPADRPPRDPSDRPDREPGYPQPNDDAQGLEV